MADRLLKRMVCHRFLVTTDGDEAFDGVLTDTSDAFFTFADVSSIAVNGDRLRLDTSLWVPRGRIKYMQAINP